MQLLVESSNARKILSDPADHLESSLWQVVDLAQEVVAHLRQVAGTDALLTAFNEARQAVQSSRDARRRQQAVQVSNDWSKSALDHQLCTVCCRKESSSHIKELPWQQHPQSLFSC